MKNKLIAFIIACASLANVGAQEADNNAVSFHNSQNAYMYPLQKYPKNHHSFRLTAENQDTMLKKLKEEHPQQAVNYFRALYKRDNEPNKKGDVPTKKKALDYLENIADDEMRYFLLTTELQSTSPYYDEFDGKEPFATTVIRDLLKTKYIENNKEKSYKNFYQHWGHAQGRFYIQNDFLEMPKRMIPQQYIAFLMYHTAEKGKKGWVNDDSNKTQNLPADSVIEMVANILSALDVEDVTEILCLEAKDTTMTDTEQEFKPVDCNQKYQYDWNRRKCKENNERESDKTSYKSTFPSNYLGAIIEKLDNEYAAAIIERTYEIDSENFELTGNTSCKKLLPLLEWYESDDLYNLVFENCFNEEANTFFGNAMDMEEAKEKNLTIGNGQEEDRLAIGNGNQDIIVN